VGGAGRHRETGFKMQNARRWLVVFVLGWEFADCFKNSAEGLVLVL